MSTQQVDERAVLRKALAALKPVRGSIAADIVNQARKSLKREWPLVTVRQMYGWAKGLIETAGVVGPGASVPDSKRAKNAEKRRRKAALDAKAGCLPTPHDKPWNRVDARQKAEDWLGSTAFAELDALPPHQGDVVRSRVVEEKKVREVAIELGISEDQVGRRCKAGIDKLREQIGANDGAPLVPAADVSLRDELMIGTVAAECARHSPEGVYDEAGEADCRGYGLTTVKRPSDSWLSSRATDAQPAHEFLN